MTPTKTSSVLSQNWHTWYLKDADSYSNIRILFHQFSKFPTLRLIFGEIWAKSCLFCLKIAPHGISRLRILIPN